jgi:hypothetical protein
MQEPVAKPAWSAKQQKNPNSKALPVAFQRDQLLSAQAGEVCKEEEQSLATQTNTVLLAFLCSKELGLRRYCLYG